MDDSNASPAVGRLSVNDYGRNADGWAWLRGETKHTHTHTHVERSAELTHAMMMPWSSAEGTWSGSGRAFDWYKCLEWSRILAARASVFALARHSVKRLVLVYKKLSKKTTN